jgi:hypothetical protein
MLDHPSRQNLGKKMRPKSDVIESDSDSDIVVDLGNNVSGTSRSERGRGRGTAVRSRRGRGSQARGTSSSRGRVSGNKKKFSRSGISVTLGKLLLIRQRIMSIWNGIVILNC